MKPQEWKEDGEPEVEERHYRQLMQNMNLGPDKDILSNHFLELRRSDYRSLTGRNLLNDNVINEYFHLIGQRNKKERLASVYQFSTHSCSWLETGNFDTQYAIVESWIKVDLTEMELILIPIHKNEHWTLISVDVKKQVLSYYDSIRGSRKTASAPRTIKRFLEKYWEQKGKVINLKKVVVENAPVQGNAYDCGVFVCQNAEKIARGVFVSIDLG